MPKKNIIAMLSDNIAIMNNALKEEMEKEVLADTYEQMVENTPADISARYWLMQFLEPLSRAELKSMINGFLVQLLNEDQARKLVKFLLIRFPQYYTEAEKPLEEPKEMNREPMVSKKKVRV